MSDQRNRPYLYVIQGEKGAIGPCGRLGLFERFPRPSYLQLAVVILIKCVLLATVIYVAQALK